MSRKKDRISTEGGRPLSNNPFAALNIGGLPEGPAEQERKPDPVPSAAREAGKKRGRVDILRQTAHRRGKTVTVVSNFTDVSPEEVERLARKMQRSCGTGGAVKNGVIEIQGDQREAVARLLKDAGFRPVFAGG